MWGDDQLVGGAAALIAITLLVGIIATAWQARVARAERARVNEHYTLEQMCARHYELMRSLCAGKAAAMAQMETTSAL